MIIGDAQTTAKIDRYAIETLQISSLVLMENAAHAFVSHLDMSKESYLVLCGKGNNGGDGYAIARLLHSRGKKVSIFALTTEGMTPDCHTNYSICKNLGITIHPSDKALYIEQLDSLLLDAEIIIDALFGTGLSSSLKKPYPEIIARINQHHKGSKVYAVDIPSGIDASTGTVMGEAIRADVTVSFVTYKKAFLNYQNQQYFGTIIVESIGFAPQKVAHLSHTFLVTKNSIKGIFKTRTNMYAHKGNFGHALIIAGSEGFTGAALLTTKACVRTGAGLVTLLSTPAVIETVSHQVCEAMTCALDTENNGQNRQNELLQKANVIAIGPGLGKSEESLKILQKVLAQTTANLVVDADAFNLLSEHKNLMEQLQHRALLTPHTGEFSRLCGLSIEKIQADPFTSAQDFARHYQVLLLLKGKNTIITDGETLYISNAGNPYMANGGMGDALTGIITGLLAQGYSLVDAAQLGAFIHGSIAEELSQSQYIINATHCIDELPQYMNGLK